MKPPFAVRNSAARVLVAGLLTLASATCGHAADITFLCAGALESWVGG